MLKKKDVKLILIISILFLILILVARYLIIQANNKETPKIYTSIEDFENLKEIVEYLGCTYIKEEKSTGEKYDKDIYLTFKYPLYTEEVSNEEYYYRLIALVIEHENYNSVRLIDLKNDIIIAVICNKEKKEIEDLVINGQSNFFGTVNNLKSIEKYQVLNISEIEIEAEEIKNLIDKEWITKDVNFGEKESSFNNYDIYFDEGLEIKTIGKKVFNIIFTEKYLDSVVNGIKVNTSFDDIEKILGTPTFNHKNYSDTFNKEIGYIGYKGKDIYIFFSENEISVFRVEKPYKGTAISDAIDNLYKDGNLGAFASHITDEWEDYDRYVYNDSSVYLKYTLRGLNVAFSQNEAGIEIYNNYNGYVANGLLVSDIIKDDTYLPSNVKLKIDEDLVDVYESERIEKYNMFNGNIPFGEYTHITDDYYVQIESNKTYFISKNRANPNSDIDSFISSYMELSSIEFILGSKNGLIKYNAKTGSTENIADDSKAITINNEKYIYAIGQGLFRYNIELQSFEKILDFANELTGIYAYGEDSIIIAITDMGIFRFDTKTNNIITLSSGEGKYIINNIFEDKIFYDDTVTLIK